MSALTMTGPTEARRALPPGSYGIGGLLRSEWTKLRTVRSTLWTLGVTIVLGVGLSALATVLTRSNWNQMDLGQRATFDPTQTSLIGIAFAQIVIGILGVLVMSAEYGTGTIRATFSAAPRRIRVLVAKAVVFGVVAFVVVEATAFVAYFLGQALLSSPAFHTTIGSPGAFRAVFGSGVYVCVLGLFALGLATIVRHTAGAISAFVGVLLVLPIITALLPNSVGHPIQRYLPGSIGSAIVSLHPDSDAFAPWNGVALLALYTVVLLAIGGALLKRRDA